MAASGKKGQKATKKKVARPSKVPPPKKPTPTTKGK